MSEQYSRIYWRFIEEFPAIFDDKAAFGWWMTLLIGADGAHPSPAPLPLGLPKRLLAQLTDAGLVEIGPGNRYRIKGVLAERTRRTANARSAGLASARSRGCSTPVQQPFNGRSTTVELDETRLDETRRDETRKDETRGAKSLGVGLPRTNGRSQQPTTEARVQELRDALESAEDPELRMGIEATIALMEVKS